MNSLVMFGVGWIVVSVVSALVIARVMGFAARKDTREPEALAAYARRPERPRHLTLVHDQSRDQRRA
jgi:transposase